MHKTMSKRNVYSNYLTVIAGQWTASDIFLTETTGN